MSTDRTIEITCDIIHKSDKALLIDDGAIKAWIPFSQLVQPSQDDLEIGQQGVEIEITEWIAKTKGLI